LGCFFSVHGVELEAIRDLKPLLRMVLSPGECKEQYGGYLDFCIVIQNLQKNPDRHEKLITFWDIPKLSTESVLL